MKKIILPSGARQFTLVVFSVLLAAAIIGLFWSYSVPLEQEEEITVYAYMQELTIDYSVYLQENDLFAERVQGPGRVYITSLTDHIATKFSYRFSGDAEAVLNCSYSISAVLMALTDMQGLLVWEKEYELLPGKNSKNQGNDISLSEEIIIPLNEYLAFAERVREETGFVPRELRLAIKYDLDLVVETEYGEVNRKFSPVLTAFFGANTFAVEGDMQQEFIGDIKETEYQMIPAVLNARRVLPVALALFVLLIGAVLLFTASSVEMLSEQEKEWADIMKKHSERVVKTKGEVNFDFGKAVAVESFDELLKIADELNRPILAYEDINKNERLMVLLTSENLYYYQLES